jgi:hypothetical protein
VAVAEAALGPAAVAALVDCIIIPVLQSPQAPLTPSQWVVAAPKAGPVTDPMAQWDLTVQLPDPVSALLQDLVAAKAITIKMAAQVDRAAAQVMVMVEPRQAAVPRKAAPLDQIMVMQVAAVL